MKAIILINCILFSFANYYGFSQCSPFPIEVNVESTCQGTRSTYYTRPPIGPISLTWSIVGGTITTPNNGLVVDVIWDTPGDQRITLTYSNTSGCSNITTTRNVTVRSSPTVTITGGVTKCYEDPSHTILSFALTGSPPWSMAVYDGWSETTINNITSSPYNIAYGPSATTTYSVTSLRSANGCPSVPGTLTSTTTITINRINPGYTSGGDIICSGPGCNNNDPDPVKVTSASAPGVLSLQWLNSIDPNQNFSPVPNATSPTYDPPPGLTQTTYYRVRLTSQLNGVSCSTISEPYERVLVEPCAVGTIGYSQIVCSGGDPVAFTETSPSLGNNPTYQWTVSSNNSSFYNIKDSTGKTYNIPPGHTQKLYYKRYFNGGRPAYYFCGGFSNTVTVDVIPSPSNTNTAAQLQSTICSGSTVNFTPSWNLPGTTCTWSTTISGSVTGASLSGNGPIINTLTNTGPTNAIVTYAITPTGTNGCAGIPVNYIVTVKPAPIASASDQSLCTGTTTSVNLSSQVSGTIFSWPVPISTNATGGSSGSGSAISQVLTASPLTSRGTVTYSVTPVANGCTGTAIPVVVTVNPITVIAPPPPATICSGATINFIPTTNVPATFNWTSTTTGPVTGASPAGTGSITNTLTNTGTSSGTVTYRITPAPPSCNGDLVNYVITVESPMSASITGPTSFCGSTTLTANPVGGTYLWSNGKTTRSITISASGTYSVTVTTSNQCAVGSASITTTRKPSSAYITASGTNICSGITLTASYGTSYVWSTGARTQSIVVRSNGTYSVTVTLSNGCTASASYSVPGGGEGPEFANVQPNVIKPPPCSTVASSSTEVSQKLIQIYPNPVDHELVIELNEPIKFELPIFIMNNVGQTILSSSFKAGENSKIIDTRTYTNGIYYVQAGASYEKMIIQH